MLVAHTLRFAVILNILLTNLINIFEFAAISEKPIQVYKFICSFKWI